MASSVHRCHTCGATEVTLLRGCPRCFCIQCDRCILALVVFRYSTRRPRHHSTTPPSCDLTLTQVPCIICRKTVEFVRIKCLSVAAHRICRDAEQDQMHPSVDCVVCCEQAFDNRVCPTCAALLCKSCLDGWMRSTRTACSNGAKYITCPVCRSKHEFDEFLHDRFVAKLARSIAQTCSGADGGKHSFDARPIGFPSTKSNGGAFGRQKMFKHACISLVAIAGVVLHRRSGTQPRDGMQVLMPTRFNLSDEVVDLGELNCSVQLLPEGDDLQIHATGLLRDPVDSLKEWISQELLCSLRFCTPVLYNGSTLKPSFQVVCRDHGPEWTIAARRLHAVRDALQLAARSPAITDAIMGELIRSQHSLSVRAMLPNPGILRTYFGAVLETPPKTRARALLKVVRSIPEFPYGHLYRSNALAHVDGVMAIDAVHTCLMLDPKNVECMSELAHLLYMRDDITGYHVQLRKINGTFPAYAKFLIASYTAPKMRAEAAAAFHGRVSM